MVDALVGKSSSTSFYEGTPSLQHVEEATIVVPSGGGSALPVSSGNDVVEADPLSEEGRAALVGEQTHRAVEFMEEEVPMVMHEGDVHLSSSGVD